MKKWEFSYHCDGCLKSPSVMCIVDSSCTMQNWKYKTDSWCINKIKKQAVCDICSLAGICIDVVSIVPVWIRHGRWSVFGVASSRAALSVGVDDSADCYQRTTRDNCCAAAAAEALLWLWRHMTAKPYRHDLGRPRSLVLNRVSLIFGKSYKTHYSNQF